MQHRTWISLSGALWACIGCWLLFKGLKILSALPDRDGATWWIGAGLFIGFLKGRFVLSKTVRRLTDRIAKLSLPIRWSTVYPKSYWFLLGGMMLLGFAFRFLPLQWRGFADVAVGSALMNGALLYFRAARSLVV